MRDTAERCHESNCVTTTDPDRCQRSLTSLTSLMSLEVLEVLVDKAFSRRRSANGCGRREPPSHSVKSIPDTSTPGSRALSVERPS